MVTETKTQAIFKTQLLNMNAPRDGEEGDPKPPVKVTFDEAQQRRVDELIREAQGRAARELRQELDTTKSSLQTIQSELEAAKAATKRGTPSQREKAGEDVEALQAQIDEMRRAGEAHKTELERLKKYASDKDKDITDAKNEALNIRKRVAIQNAASKLNFVDLEDVITLTERSIQWDADKNDWKVVADNGAERYNSAYETMGIADFYTELSNKKPWMVRGDVRGGTGSSESSRTNLGAGKYAVEEIFGKKSDPIKANKLALSDMKEYKRLKEVALAARLI